MQSDTGQNYYIVQGSCPTPRLPSHGHRLHMPYQGCEGTPDWVDVLALGRKRRLRSSMFVLVIRRTAAGRRGAGGGWVAAAVAAARVGRSRGAVVQFIDKVVIVLTRLMHVPAVQSVHGQFIDRVLDISVVLREGTHSANCAEDCAWCRRPCDQQRQVPTVQRFESSCPRFSSSSEW